MEMDELTPNLMQVIAQGMPGLHPLSNDVASALSQDTELFVREVIQLALSFQAHTKQSSLSVHHVASAIRIITGSAPLGYGAQYETQRLPFKSVPNADGVFVYGDEIISLVALREAPLPDKPCAPPPGVSWLRPPTAATRASDKFACTAAASALAQTPPDTAQEAVNALLKRATDHLRRDGSSDVLFRVVVACGDVARSASPGVRTCAHEIVRVVLSVLLAPFGSDDNTRRVSAAILTRILIAFDDVTTVRARVITTLVSALTLPGIPLDVLHGAVLGLAACGNDACIDFLAPCLPALLNTLIEARKQAQQQPEEEASRTIELVSRISDTAAYACSNLTSTSE